MIFSEIETVRLCDLFLATPYTIDVSRNFGFKLDEKIFQTNLYTSSFDETRISNQSVEKNVKFDRTVKEVLLGLTDRYSKVNVLHISGVTGCGKTTYIRHLLWRFKDVIGQYEIIDYEGCTSDEQPFIARIIKLLGEYPSEVVSDFFNAIICGQEKGIFELTAFSDLIPYLQCFKRLLVEIDVNKESIYEIIHMVRNKCSSKIEYLRFLITVEFLLILISRFLKKEDNPIVLVIDHFDHVSYLSGNEEILLSAIIQFSKDCNYFFADNYNSTQTFHNKSVERVFQNTKLQIILTTRLTSGRRYESFYPDWELMHGWTNVIFPENFYDQKAIISTRVNFFNQIENIHQSLVARKLLYVRGLSEVAYYTPTFSRLFNGSIRFCIYTLCDIVERYPEQMIKEVFSLYHSSSGKAIYIGAVGFFMGLLLDYFKMHGIFEEKLHLKSYHYSCEAIPLSRIVLTVLREKGGRCSLLDMFVLLEPLGITTETIIRTIWDLSMSSRNIWRSLIVFEMHVPITESDLIEQAKMFKRKIYDVKEYTELVMCSSGDAYLSDVLSHFEYMQSTYDLHRGINEMTYLPLFANDSEEIIIGNNGEEIYRFELKIRRVFNEVRKCCHNSRRFAALVMAKEGLSEYEYLNLSFYNYHTSSLYDWQDYKLSYESRIIFAHIAYIDNYRRYLLVKYRHEGFQKQNELSQKLIEWIITYLKLCKHKDVLLSPNQEETVARLWSESKKILSSSDFMFNDITGHGAMLYNE